MATVQDVMAAFAGSHSATEAGSKFEQLMVEYFRLDPMLAQRYEHVWLWQDWPGRAGKADTGIDIVAQERGTGDLTAVQCKFYAPTTMVQKPDIDSFLSASGKQGFTNRIIISTTDKWGRNAEDALVDQQIPVQRIGLAELAAAPINWDLAWPGNDLRVELAPAQKFAPRPHQQEAIAKIHAGFTTHDRGQWISACGTGKTFTSLKLAEEMATQHGGALRVLFLAPSIQLVAQTLREWTAQTTTDLRAFVVCSDTRASRAAEDISPHDVPLPATTDPAVLQERLAVGRRAAGLTVVFSTYQSIDVVAQAQGLGAGDFDLILCDEAHRTTGVKLAGEDESAFVRVHDNTFIRATKRLYMTATPRMFGDDVKTKADEHSAELSSMDDEAKFGPVFHRLGFGEAVERNLLTDYKVMVLVVTEEQMAAPMQAMMAGDNLEIPLDDAAKILGCWNTLAKRTHPADDQPAFPAGATPMKRAVAFLENIKSSKRVADVFGTVVEATGGAEATQHLATEARHVDGTMNALERANHLAWLKAPVEDGECRILTNARCLSEGVDVPALDAVMFLSPRSSSVDVVQSVGRVMRRAPGKDFGYIILPVAVPVGVDPAHALRDNKRFKVVWEVLNALRAHDDRFEAVIQSIQLNGGKDPSGRFIIDTPDSPNTHSDRGTENAAAQFPLFALDQWRDAIYSRIVTRVGTREYWDQWAADVARMSAAQVARINAILERAPDHVTEAFDAFLTGLRGNLNDSITHDDAVSMLSQHLITAPVFDALFGESSFAAHNPVSIGMNTMLELLEEQDHGLEAETEQLERFYQSVRMRASQVTDTAGRQAVIHDLYEKFFKNAFPKQADALGVVYTPIEVVDFIIRAADHLSREHFGQGLTDEGVTILDPFTGTGTFIVRLLQSGIIRPEDLARKYTSELLANEIMLLAYYIACVNIEATYEALTDSDEYVPFPGAVMTDTFQISEDGDRADTSLIPANNDRITKQLDTDITVILGNPPYSVGQTSANDDNKNLAYPTLDSRIADTYAKLSTATNKNSLYDSYIRAYRWATDRLNDRGIMAFVSNGGWLDGNTADGMRLSMVDDFNEIWIFNLRGNARTAGEQRKKEAGNVFESGSRNTVAITIGIKNPARTGPATIHYRDIGDYQTREQKLATLTTATLADAHWTQITPNEEGDWLNQRDETFASFIPIASKTDEPRIFRLTSNGLKTNRDAWCYNFSEQLVVDNMTRMIDTYNEGLGTDPVHDPTQISWNRGLLRDHERGKEHVFDDSRVFSALYRPFTRQYAYFDRSMNDMVYRMYDLFPTPNTSNIGYYVPNPGNSAPPFMVLATDALLDNGASGISAASYFARWTYEPGPKRAGYDTLFDPEGELIDGHRRLDNITDEALQHFQTAFGSSATKDDIFYYVYSVLHSQQYRDRFEADLKKMLPRIPLAANLEDFCAFADAGRELMDLHVNYETVEPYPLAEQVAATVDMDDYELFAVDKKMKFPKKAGVTDRSTLIYNTHVTLTGIPEEAYRYQLGSRSAIEWIIDRYHIRTDKASGIVNDPNDWSREVGDPRHIIDLIERIITVSLETMRIVDSLPSLPLSSSAKRL